MTTNASATNYTDSTVVHVLMSEEYFARMWLHVLLLLVVMVVGVPGNSMVIAVFFKSQRRKRYNSTQLLVLALAITDLSVCTLLVPFDLHRLRYFFSLQVCQVVFSLWVVFSFHAGMSHVFLPRPSQTSPCACCSSSSTCTG